MFNVFFSTLQWRVNVILTKILEQIAHLDLRDKFTVYAYKVFASTSVLFAYHFPLILGKL